MLLALRGQQTERIFGNILFSAYLHKLPNTVRRGERRKDLREASSDDWKSEGGEGALGSKETHPLKLKEK
jgi:hypothetical protein